MVTALVHVGFSVDVIRLKRCWHIYCALLSRSRILILRYYYYFVLSMIALKNHKAIVERRSRMKEVRLYAINRLSRTIIPVIVNTILN